MMADEMIHGSIAGPRARRIDQDTPIVPHAIAEAVCEEVASGIPDFQILQFASGHSG